MICPFCFGIHTDLLPVGVDHPVIVRKKIIGAGYRFVKCPTCGSKDRDRLVYTFLVDYLGVFKKQFSILHIAPEKVILKRLTGHVYDYVTGDIDLSRYSKSDNIRQTDLLNTGFSDGRFDLIICNHVLEHIVDEQRALQEIKRILKVGGSAILQVPISPLLQITEEDPKIITNKDRLEHFGQHDHVRLYGIDYEDRLKKIGFKLQSFSLFEKYPNFGLNPEEKLYLASKSDD
ncbi:class I SAM-dependent methyltransferase [Sphingobacterium ginsenosidimutans]|uniref:class I SAM-dependent methyltransferase n=1 Tax=Sphingobacterium ginsenosidimutans TaxID=687845 RepID=UPI0031F8257F